MSAGGAVPARWTLFLIMGIYQFVFVVLFLLYSPVLVWRMILNPAYRTGFLERMGRVPRLASAKPVVWIHGVSVGEVKAAGSLIDRLREDYPGHELVLSSTTPTGHSLACKLHKDLRVIYYPLDFGAFPHRALDRVRPSCVLLMELEIWPNFIMATRRRGIPVAVVNGRMSEQSFKGYRLLRGMIPPFFLVDRFCVQDDSYRQRLLALDVEPGRIFLTGNVKYDSVALKDPTDESVMLRSWLSPDGRIVLVCGSTHGDEDVGLAKTAARLRSRLGIPIRLVLAPRHPERSSAVRDSVMAMSMRCTNWSSLPPERPPLADDDILIVDTIGQLENFYGACDVAFVGGSMVPHGGQNMLEPAALGKAVVFGPHVANFLTDVRLLLHAEAAVQASGWDALEVELGELCTDAERRRALGERAVAVIRENKGATDRTLTALRPMFDQIAS